MNKHEANVLLAVILTTVAETPDGAPEGVMYAALMNRVELADFQSLLSIAQQVGLITRARHVVTITARGLALAAKLEAFAKESHA